MKDENVIQIELINKEHLTQELVDLVKHKFAPIFNVAEAESLWMDSIKKIVVTDDFEGQVNKQATLWSRKIAVTKAKEYAVICKLLFNQNIEKPEFVIFCPIQILNLPDDYLQEIIIGSIVEANVKISPVILNIKMPDTKTSLTYYVVQAAKDWSSSLMVRNQLTQVLKQQKPRFNHNTFLLEFKRKLKRELFNYNSDYHSKEENLSVFWNNYSLDLIKLVMHIIDNNTKEIKFHVSDDEECKEALYNIIDEIETITDALKEKEELDVNSLKIRIQQFSSFFNIDITEPQDRIKLHLTKNPKEYFRNILVDTEPRIICFLDILGFSNYIQKYEDDITSTFLQDIQESFTIAKKQLLDNKDLITDEDVEYLEYQTFSDNIAISIPYFDNEENFLSNLNIIATYIRGFQLIMMAKGFFTRGGLSLGSYYADNNIIFSKGLVNAYMLESKKAIYPRVIIDDNIIKKVLTYNEQSVVELGLDKAIVLDWENQAFINPFGITDNAKKQYDTTINSLDVDAISKITNLPLQDVINKTDNLLNQINKGEQENISTIKVLVGRNLVEWKGNDKVYSKYLWFQEFIKWIEGDHSSKLQFLYLADLLNKTNTDA